MKKLIFALLTIAIFTGCNRKPYVTTNTITKDSIRVVEVPRIITVPGATITQRINVDSLMNLIKSGIRPEVINRTLVTTDTANIAKLQIMIDHMGNLLITCEALQREVEAKDKEIYRLTTQIQATQQQMKADNALLRSLKGIRDIVLIIVAAILIVTLIRLFK